MDTAIQLGLEWSDSKSRTGRILKPNKLIGNVQSLKTFLSKYTETSFDEKFETVMKNVEASTNQYKSAAVELAACDSREEQANSDVEEVGARAR